MAKKSFKDNPALQFISDTEPEAKEQKPIEKEEPVQNEWASIPKGYKLNPQYVEVKSRRLQLVLQPSLYKRVKKQAKAHKLSVNEYVHRVLDQATREDAEKEQDA